jgi:hypothetical protein
VVPAPHPCRLSVAQPAPACHARPPAHLGRQHLPGNAGLQGEKNAGEAGNDRECWDALPSVWAVPTEEAWRSESIGVPGESQAH